VIVFFYFLLVGLSVKLQTLANRNKKCPKCLQHHNMQKKQPRKLPHRFSYALGNVYFKFGFLRIFIRPIDLGARFEQTDRQTHGRTGKICNAFVIRNNLFRYNFTSFPRTVC